MAVRSQNHLSAARQHFSGKLMDHRLMRGDIDSAVALRAGQAEHVIVLVDRAAHSARTVVAVGQHIGNRKFLQSAGPCRLNDPHKCNVMGSQLVKLNFQLFHISGRVVSRKNPISHGILRRFLLIRT